MLTDSSYLGHYIILVGVDENGLYYLDPARKGRHFVAAVNFEVARKAAGTDEDLIFILK